MRKRLVNKSIAVFLMLVFIASSNVLAQDSTRSQIDFNIGVIIPLTGDLAEYGAAIKNGFEMAVSESPLEFSQINFIYEDSKYEGKTAVTALQKLNSSNSIDLYYLWGVSPTEALLPIAAAQKLAVIAETTVKEATVGKPLVVRAARTGERIAKALAAELENRKFKSVSVIVDQIPFYIDIVKHLEISLKEKGISLRQKREILPGESDFKSFLLDRSSSEGEAQGVFLLPAQFPIFFRQANQLNFPLRAFNAEIIDSESIVEECPGNIDGTFFTQVGVTPEFRKAYRTKFGVENQVGSGAQSYDVAKIVGSLFSKLEKNLLLKKLLKEFLNYLNTKG